jgi:hypothetical protein
MSTSMPELPRTNEGKRICQVIKVKPEALDDYKKVNFRLQGVEVELMIVSRSSLARGLGSASEISCCR